MEDLYSLSQSEKKVWKTMPNGTHNDTVAEPSYFKYVFDFIEEVV
jgi:hypothetical protein